MSTYLITANDDSITTPVAGPLSSALSSKISACKTTESSSVSIPSPVRAEIGTKIVSPPQSSGTTLFACQSQKRIFKGCDYSKEYIDKISERLKSEKK
mgnify:CR=1 FL=1